MKRVVLLALGVLLALSLVRMVTIFKAARIVVSQFEEVAKTTKPRFKAATGEWLNNPSGSNFSASSVDLSTVPPFFIQALFASEDKRFYQHIGVDLIAILHAAFINVKNLKIIRGSSTITEQVAGILLTDKRGVHRRIKTFITALLLEQNFPKEQILRFYINQVQLPGNVRGIEDGARTLFARDFELLSKSEILALVSTIRAPEGLNPNNIDGRKKLNIRIRLLSQSLLNNNQISDDEYKQIVESEIVYSKSREIIRAPHFIRSFFNEDFSSNNTVIETTLDGPLQQFTNNLLKRSLENIKSKGARDGAAIVIDINSGAVKAWSSISLDDQSEIDGVLVPRQPGSTLKPFLYAMALQKGWSAATILNDDPLSRPVSNGLKTFQNYSRTYYGPIRLREALGNSLNIPAVEAIGFVGIPEFLEHLRALGFRTLQQPASYYGEGLALGNGEVPLIDLVNAYAVLARRGSTVNIKKTYDAPSRRSQSILQPEVSLIITDILSDTSARQREFNSESTSLRYKVAYKTGTSTDFHDAWVVGYSGSFVVGIWMGDFQRRPMKEVTGSMGPLMVMNGIFSELGRIYGENSVITSSPNLSAVEICAVSGLKSSANCPRIFEYFSRNTNSLPTKFCDGVHNKKQVEDVPSVKNIFISSPTPGLRIAMDPRLPSALQKFPLEISNLTEDAQVEWKMNGIIVGTGRKYLWTIQRGSFEVQADVIGRDGKLKAKLPLVKFYVR